jgi:hypothetical protein
MIEIILPLCTESEKGPKRHEITWIKEGEGDSGFIGCVHCQKPADQITSPDVKTQGPRIVGA